MAWGIYRCPQVGKLTPAKPCSRRAAYARGLGREAWTLRRSQVRAGQKGNHPRRVFFAFGSHRLSLIMPVTFSNPSSRPSLSETIHDFGRFMKNTTLVVYLRANSFDQLFSSNSRNLRHRDVSIAKGLEQTGGPEFSHVLDRGQGEGQLLPR
jgi:hypothetical protein